MVENFDKNLDIEILDTTLRDGAQAEGISFSVDDKLAITEALDELGVSWIEAGNPGSNPKDAEFFHACQAMHLRKSRLCAFGSTRKKGEKAEDDEQLLDLLSAETPAVVIFGKSSRNHVLKILNTTLEENLAMIRESVSFLKAQGRDVMFDAEHFFDGWLEDRVYAEKCIAAAAEAGASRIVLCDTNGGSFPELVGKASASAKRLVGDNCIIGNHTHNDMGLALACSLAALKSGALHIQGTLLGYGERCGNNPLSALIPCIELKLKKKCLVPDDDGEEATQNSQPETNNSPLYKLTEICRKVAEISNVIVATRAPYIGRTAFSHKAGMHTDGVLKNQSSFEHINPAAVGNSRKFLISEQGGRSAIAERLRLAGIIDLHKNSPELAVLSRILKKRELDGWQYEGADASFELFAENTLNLRRNHFSVLLYHATSEHPAVSGISSSYSWVKVQVGEKTEIAAAEGVGPVNALSVAVRRALQSFFPVLDEMHLSDFKVRVIDGNKASEAKVRVLVESKDSANSWTTLGVSTDIIEASVMAVCDSIEYKLRMLTFPRKNV